MGIKKIAGIALGMIGIAACVTTFHFYTGKSKTHTEKKENIREYSLDEGYGIALTDYMYEADTAMGEADFLITAEAGKPEADMDAGGSVNSFGVDGRYFFDIHGSRNIKGEYQGDTLYVHISFEAEAAGNDPEDILFLCDREHPEGNESYAFPLVPNVKSKTYEKDFGKIVLSSLGIKIFSDSRQENHYIRLHYKDGAAKVIVDEAKGIGTGNSGVREKTEEGKTVYEYSFPFRKNINIDQIEELEYKTAENAAVEGGQTDEKNGQI